MRIAGRTAGARERQRALIATLKRPVALARMTARAASASVSADATRHPGPQSPLAATCLEQPRRARWTRRIEARTATSVLVRAGRERRRPEPLTPTLRFATVAVNQRRRGATRAADVGPVLERVALFDRGLNHAGREPSRRSGAAPPSPRARAAGVPRRRAHGLSPRCARPLDSSEVATQVVLEFPHARFHGPIIATCGHSRHSPTTGASRRSSRS